MTDARVRGALADQRARLPQVDANGRPVIGYHVGPGAKVFGDPRELVPVADDPVAQAMLAGRPAREVLRAERARLPAADHNGRVPPPPDPEPAPAAAGGAPPARRAPRPDPSQGSHSAPLEPTRAQKAAAAQADGRVLDALRLINEPIHRAREMGMSVQEWSLRYDR